MDIRDESKKDEPKSSSEDWLGERLRLFKGRFMTETEKLLNEFKLEMKDDISLTEKRKKIIEEKMENIEKRMIDFLTSGLKEGKADIRIILKQAEDDNKKIQENETKKDLSDNKLENQKLTEKDKESNKEGLDEVKDENNKINLSLASPPKTTNEGLRKTLSEQIFKESDTKKRSGKKMRNRSRSRKGIGVAELIGMNKYQSPFKQSPRKFEYSIYNSPLKDEIIEKKLPDPKESKKGLEIKIEKTFHCKFQKITNILLFTSNTGLIFCQDSGITFFKGNQQKENISNIKFSQGGGLDLYGNLYTVNTTDSFVYCFESSLDFQKENEQKPPFKVLELEIVKKSPIFYNRHIFISLKKSYLFIRKSNFSLQVYFLDTGQVSQKNLVFDKIGEDDEILNLIFYKNSEGEEKVLVVTRKGLMFTVEGLNEEDVHKINISDEESKKINFKLSEFETFFSTSYYCESINSIFIASRYLKMKNTGKREFLTFLYWVKITPEITLRDKKVMKPSKNSLCFPLDLHFIETLDKNLGYLLVPLHLDLKGIAAFELNLENFFIGELQNEVKLNDKNLNGVVRNSGNKFWSFGNDQRIRKFKIDF